MTSLLLAAAFFIGIHFFIAGTRLRDILAGALGERAFQALFSLLSLIGIVWLCRAYGQAGPVALWGRPDSLRPVMFVAMLLAFQLVGIGLTTPSPTAAGGGSQLRADRPDHGILRITRHPFLMGVALWALSHLILSGDAASILLFGTFLFLAISGPSSIDAKRKSRFGADWDRFAAVTSIIPFAAVIQGRNSLDLAEIGWWRIGFGLALFVLFLSVHGWLFGVSPLSL